MHDMTSGYVQGGRRSTFDCLEQENRYDHHGRYSLWKLTRYKRPSKLERLPVRACAVLQAVSRLLYCNGIGGKIAQRPCDAQLPAQEFI